MATLMNVMDALKAAVTAAIYPAGVPENSIAPGVGAPVKIMEGWPLPADLNTASAATPPYVIVSIYPRPNTAKRTTRFLRRWQVLTPPSTLTTVSVQGNSITISAVNAGDNIIIACGKTATFGYQVVPGDTAATAASNLAQKIAVVFPGTAASGDVIIVAGQPGIIAANAASAGVAARELRRQEEQFQVSIWAPTVVSRSATGAVIDPALAAIDFLQFVDGSAGRMLFTTEVFSDDKERANVFIHHLIYTIDYPTIETRQVAEIGGIGFSFQ